MEETAKIILRGCGKGSGMITEVETSPNWDFFDLKDMPPKTLSEELSVLTEPIFAVDHKVEDGNVVLVFVFAGEGDNIIQWRIILYCMREFLLEGMKRMYKK